MSPERGQQWRDRETGEVVTVSSVEGPYVWWLDEFYAFVDEFVESFEYVGHGEAEAGAA